MQFNARRFLEANFTSRKAVLEALTEWGFKVPARVTVDKWYSRNSVSADYLAALCLIVELRGTPLVFANYFDRGA